MVGHCDEEELRVPLMQDPDNLCRPLPKHLDVHPPGQVVNRTVRGRFKLWVVGHHFDFGQARAKRR